MKSPEQQIEVLKLVISAVERAAKTAKLNAGDARNTSEVSQEFDCIAQDLDYFISEMKLCGIGSTITASKRKTK